MQKEEEKILIKYSSSPFCMCMLSLEKYGWFTKLAVFTMSSKESVPILASVFCSSPPGLSMYLEMWLPAYTQGRAETHMAMYI